MEIRLHPWRIHTPRQPMDRPMEERKRNRKSTSSLSPLSQTHFPVRTPSGSGTKVPHTDPLPTHYTDLEGLLNHHAGELQRLADRCDFLNEWMDMDCVVLEGLKRGVRFEVEGEFAVAVAAVGQEEENPRPEALTAERERDDMGGKKLISKEEMEAIVEDQYAENCRITELTERVAMIKKWRKELERSVVWQRDENLRVEIALGRKSHSGSRKAKVARMSDGSQEDAVVELDGKELLGVVGAGGKWVGEEWRYCREKWSRGTGRLPTQTEWEEMFGHYEERRMEERKKFVG